MIEDAKKHCMDKIKWLESEIQLMVDLNNKIHIDMVLEDFINEVLKIIKEKSYFEGANITLADYEKGMMKTYPLSPELYEDPQRYAKVKTFFGQEFSLNSKIWICQVAIEQKEIYHPDISSKTLPSFIPEERIMLEYLGYSGCFFVPLLLGDQSVGTLVLYNMKKPLDLKEEEKYSIRRLATMIARAVENTRIYNAIRNQKEIIEKQNQELAQKNKIIKTKNQQLMDDLQLARKIQENLIPSTMPRGEKISFSAVYKPMEAVGGDFYDFIRVQEPNILGIFISDVSGHGVPAALITSMVKTLIETAGSARLTPKDLLKYINDKITDQTNGNFLTAFYGVYEQETRIFRYSRASHNFPYLIRHREIIPLESKGKMLGVIKGISFEEKQILLQPGDRLLFYTDGLTEAVNSAGMEFGEILPELLVKDSKNINEYVRFIYHELLKFREDYHFEDDVCLVGMEVS